MVPSLTRLHHLVTVARIGNISRAAEQLHLSQPALSRSIRMLEQQYGTVLFDRSRSGVVPTAVGRQIIGGAEEVLRSAAAADRHARACAGGEAGTLSVGIGPLIASLMLPQLAAAFLRERPGMQLHTTIRTPVELVANLKNDAIELIIGNGWIVTDEPGLVAQEIGVVPLALLARENHPLRAQGVVQSADLRHFPIASATTLPPLGFSPEAGLFVCDSYDLLMAYTVESDAVCLCASAVAANTASSGLSILNVSDLAPVTSVISLIFPVGRTLSPSAKALVDTFVQTLRVLEDRP